MHALVEADLAQLRGLRGGEEPLWLDLRNPDEEELDSVGEILGLHPLAIEDSRDFGQRPKLDRYDDRFLLVFFGLHLDVDDNPEQVEVHIHVTPAAVLTISRVPAVELAPVRKALEQIPDCSRGQLVYRILDTLTDSASDHLQTIASGIGVVSQTILTRPRVSDRDRMALLGRLLDPLHRTLSIQRLAFDRAADQIAATAGPDEDLHPYFADIADHLSLALDDVDADRDKLDGLIATYSNVVQERLTIVATIFLPLSVLTGFFGMNFTWLNNHEVGTWTFFGLGVGSLVVSSLLIVAWLQRSGMTNRRTRSNARRDSTAGPSPPDAKHS